MRKLTYENIGAGKKSGLRSKNPEVKSKAMLSQSLHNQNWREVLTYCLKGIKSKNSQVQAAGIIGLGHLARIHKKTSFRKTLPLLAQFKETELSGLAEDAIMNINFYTKPKNRQKNECYFFGNLPYNVYRKY